MSEPNQPSTNIDPASGEGAVHLPSGGLGGSSGASGKNAFTISAEKTNRLDQLLDSSSEWFSSIVIKETRQSLKGRFFVWPFFACLLVVLIWALGAIGMAMYNGALNEAGPVLLTGFLDILGFPLAIVIPYATFRSLVHEFEDGTLQLVSITTLRPYQIITGKLVSALLQILIYVSILAPCIVFTYMLRGVDIWQIFLSIATAVSGSVSLCVFGLFLASSSRHRAIGILSSLVLLAALCWVYFMWCVLAYGIGFEIDGLPIAEPEFQTAIFAPFACVFSWGLVMFAAACANITFPTENRSTIIKLALLIQQTLFLGWFLAMTISMSEINSAMFGSLYIFVCIHWLVVGTMMFCVGDGMSRRVRRGLPKTRFGQVFSSFLQPGAGRGFLFAVSNLWACGLFFAMVLLLGRFLPGQFELSYSNVLWEEIVGIMATMTLYTTFYLVVLFLLLNALPAVRKRSGPMFGLLIVLLFMPMILLLPILLQFSVLGGEDDYTLLQMFNCFWTSFEIVNGNDSAWISVILVFILTAIFGFVALRLAGRELRVKVEAVPQRVKEEIDSGKSIAAALPEGESLDEIFGVLEDPKDP
ncbi:MAG: hypothetical protein AAF456_25195 [Planctomycetota bacterium]